jgi:hypothetical protein
MNSSLFFFFKNIVSFVHYKYFIVVLRINMEGIKVYRMSGKHLGLRAWLAMSDTERRACKQIITLLSSPETLEYISFFINGANKTQNTQSHR